MHHRSHHHLGRLLDRCRRELFLFRRRQDGFFHRRDIDAHVIFILRGQGGTGRRGRVSRLFHVRFFVPFFTPEYAPAGLVRFLLSLRLLLFQKKTGPGGAGRRRRLHRGRRFFRHGRNRCRRGGRSRGSFCRRAGFHPAGFFQNFLDIVCRFLSIPVHTNPHALIKISGPSDSGAAAAPHTAGCRTRPKHSVNRSARTSAAKPSGRRYPLPDG